MPRGGTAANRQASKQFEALEPRRLLAASGYDASFGGGSGWIGTEVPIPTGTTPVAAFQQADGKIIASAGSGDQGLVRFNVDGSLDETFGQHGRVNGRSCLYIRAIARLSDGKILVVGHETSQNGFRVTRVNSDGSIDSSFGTGGSVNITVPQMASGYADITSVAVDSLGRIVVLGDEWSTGYPDLFIVRLTADGTPDTTFSGDGIAILQQPDSQHAGSMLLQADGRIIIASRPYGTNVVARFNVDGTQDMAFGSGGYLTLPSGFSNVNAMALDASGRLLLTGEGYGVASGYNAAVARYSAEGQLDASFGVGGQR